ncbi:Bug family tripartite tricarboxylate transporter substrate binding protein [Delftia tsuruhatensis]|uniref:Bug family tripartite tricarboxylate transporter substrate binding protein n=1 Tax=Delftia tsuruhatensis TaxID=180282 RepID=UPI001F2C12C8|nr:tripartite tricarboxylate transporter substrate-binding protein [Delftia tsuruhatensis]
MPLSRRSLVSAATLVASVLAAAPAALAAPAATAAPAWPAGGPITLIVPFGAGTDVDATARLIAGKLGARLKQSVVVDNVPASGGVLGVSKVARSHADGYTLLLGFDGPVSIAQLVNSSVRYDAERDLAAVGLVTVAPMVIVARPGLPVHNLNELIAMARARPGALTYATPGVGTVLHLAMERLQERARIRLVHVPYRGVAQVSSEVLGGQVDVGILMTTGATPLVQQKKLEGVGVTSAQRIDAIPGVMSFAEAPDLRGSELYAWTGLFAPAKTPEAVVQRLAEELGRVLQMPEVRKRLEDGGATPGSGTPATFAEFLKKEKAGYAQIVKSANIQLE